MYGGSQCRIARSPGSSISVKLRDLNAGYGLVGQLSKADLSGGKLLVVLYKLPSRSCLSEQDHPSFVGSDREQVAVTTRLVRTIVSYHRLQITHAASFILLE